MFYNCTSLSSIKDIKDWKISLENNSYLMFYNCISLIFFSNKDKFNLENFNIKKNDLFLGLLLTRYLIYEKEIIMKNIIEDNNKVYLNLFGKEFIIYNIDNNILIFNGKGLDLIIYTKSEKINEEGNEFIVYKKMKIKKIIIKK